MSVNVLDFKVGIVVREVQSTSHRKEILTIAAANSAEIEKEKKYEEYEQRNKTVVVPFGVSSSGEYGDSAKTLLTLLCKISNCTTHPLLVSSLIERISLIIESIRSYTNYEYEQQIHFLSSRLPSSLTVPTTLPTLPLYAPHLKPSRKKFLPPPTRPFHSSFWSSVHTCYDSVADLQLMSSYTPLCLIPEDKAHPTYKDPRISSLTEDISSFVMEHRAALEYVAEFRTKLPSSLSELDDSQPLLPTPHSPHPCEQRERELESHQPPPARSSFLSQPCVVPFSQSFSTSTSSPLFTSFGSVHEGELPPSSSTEPSTPPPPRRKPLFRLQKRSASPRFRRI
jgi:hypothetical protein